MECGSQAKVRCDRGDLRPGRGIRQAVAFAPEDGTSHDEFAGRCLSTNSTAAGAIGAGDLAHSCTCTVPGAFRERKVKRLMINALQRHSSYRSANITITASARITGNRIRIRRSGGRSKLGSGKDEIGRKIKDRIREANSGSFSGVWMGMEGKSLELVYQAVR